MKISMDNKYRTRDGRDVRLLCVDGPSEWPVGASLKEQLNQCHGTLMAARVMD